MFSTRPFSNSTTMVAGAGTGFGGSTTFGRSGARPRRIDRNGSATRSDSDDNPDTVSELGRSAV